jgi:ABC-type transport system substrate-binding protein
MTESRPAIYAKRRMLLLIASLMSIVAIIAVGCGGGDTVVTEVTVVVKETVIVSKDVEKIVIATATARPADTGSAPASSGGDLVVGLNLIPPPIFMPSFMNFQVETIQAMGIFEGLLVASHIDPPAVNRDYGTFLDGIAESWDISSDISTLTFKIRKGVQFHHGWGEVTAHDVVWSFDNVMSEATRSTRGPQIREWSTWESDENTGWTAVDDYTVEIALADLLPTWASALSNVGGGTPVIVSKKLFDERGENSALTTAVGTGPFEATEWLADDHILARPFADHYRQVPTINSVRWVLMPEPATQMAAFRVGEIQMAPMAPRFAVPALDSVADSWAREVGSGNPQTVIFGGNYWAETDENGEAINYSRPGFLADDDHPWIGDPRDEASMEEARKYRWALSMAVDREQLLKDAQGGFGWAAYSRIDIHPGNPLFKDEWTVPYDLELAKQYIAESRTGECGKFTMHIANDRAMDFDVGQAIGQFWRALGCEVEFDQTGYRTARPKLVNRDKQIPWMQTIGRGVLPDARQCCGWPSAGYNEGIEWTDEIIALVQKNSDIKGTTYEERVANNIEFQDWISKWQLAAAYTVLPTIVVVSPDVTTWEPYGTTGPLINNLASVVMK